MVQVLFTVVVLRYNLSYKFTHCKTSANTEHSSKIYAVDNEGLGKGLETFYKILVIAVFRIPKKRTGEFRKLQCDSMVAKVHQNKQRMLGLIVTSVPHERWGIDFIDILHRICGEDTFGLLSIIF